MSVAVTLSRLTVSFGARELFHDLDAVVGPDEVVGLVGPNGCGKTTLLRTIAGLHAQDSGSVTWSPPGARIGYLPQERTHSGTVGEHLTRLTGVQDADDRMQRAAEGLAQGAPGADARYSIALEDWLGLGGPDLDARIEATLAQVVPGLPLEHPMQGLSGGQSARVGLAGLLLSRFDAYLLDEPTNDLDLDGLEMAEQFLAGIRGPVLLVSHDREFLARRITRVLDFDPALETVGDYRGGFDAYSAERSRARGRAQEEYDAVAATREDLLAQMRAARATSDRGAKVARAKHRSGSIDKMLRDAMIDGATAGAASAGRVQRQVDRLPDVVEPRREWQLRFRVAEVERSGDVVATLRGAITARGSFRMGPIDLQVDRGDCVVITGANGSGKSTLLGMLLGDIAVGVRAPESRGPGRHRTRGPVADPGGPGRHPVGHGDSRVGRDARGGGARTAGQVRAGCRSARYRRRPVVAGRAHPYRPGRHQRPGCQRPGHGRADEPSGPAGHRAGRGRTGPVRGHDPARQP